MPNGYTAPIYDGKTLTLKEFATRAARGMGVFMHQRDESLDEPLRYPKLNTFYVEAAEKAVAERARWNSLTPQEKSAEYRAYADEVARRNAQRKDDTVMLERYNAVLSAVDEKEVPERLQSFKDIMLQWLKDSRNTDCAKNLREPYRPQTESEWIEKATNQKEADVFYYQKQAEEAARWYHENIAYINLMVKVYGLDVEPAR